jgi:hypothetical protein
MTDTSDIIVYYSTVDGYRTSKRFRLSDLPKAKLYAQEWIGKYPSMGSHYAVSDDGIGKIEVAGATLHDLFPGA